MREILGRARHAFRLRRESLHLLLPLLGLFAFISFYQENTTPFFNDADGTGSDLSSSYRDNNTGTTTGLNSKRIRTTMTGQEENDTTSTMSQDGDKSSSTMSTSSQDEDTHNGNTLTMPTSQDEDTQWQHPTKTTFSPDEGKARKETKRIKPNEMTKTEPNQIKPNEMTKTTPNQMKKTKPKGMRRNPKIKMWGDMNDLKGVVGSGGSNEGWRFGGKKQYVSLEEYPDDGRKVDNSFQSLLSLPHLSSPSSKAPHSINGSDDSVLDLLHLPWKDDPTNPARAISACQDWRTYPPYEKLPQPLRRDSFSQLVALDPLSMRILQVHMLLPRSFFSKDGQFIPKKLFSHIEIHWSVRRFNQSTSSITVEEFKALPSDSHAILPSGHAFRFPRSPNLELIVRSAFFLPTEVWNAAQERKEETQMRLAIYAASNLAYFPLDQVAHFPQPMPLLADRLPTVGEGRFPRQPHPSTPWAAKLSNGRKHWDDIVRATGPAAILRVGAWITKKFSWTEDDDLWVMWVLDIIGVDHVVLVIATTSLNVETLRLRFQLERPDLMERITIMRNDAPQKETFCFLQELLLWDLFLRWALDFDYALVCDTDEFLQLFETTTPFRRVDIKTFITNNRDYLQNSGFIEFERVLVIREKKNMEPEPLLPPFLDSLLTCNSKCMESLVLESNPSVMELGKSIFFINGTLQPYLHYGIGYPKKKPWAFAEGHFLHIRQPFEEHEFGPQNRKGNGSLSWWWRWIFDKIRS